VNARFCGVGTWVWMLLLIALLGLACGSSGRTAASSAAPPASDDDTDIGNDDDDDNDDNDNDDSQDDDQSPADDDQSPADDDDSAIYSGLVASGLPLGQMAGIVTHMSGWSDADWTRAFELAGDAQLGVARLRRDFSWSEIEPQEGQWDWTECDGFYQIAQANNLDFIALLDYGVSWAMPDGDTSEIAPVTWAAFAGAVAERYCEHIKRYEVWNEENTSRFWQPLPDPEHYGLMLEAAYAAIKQACPDAEVMFGGISSFDGWTILHGMYNYIGRVAQAVPDICQYFDSMAIHPYTFVQQWAPEAGFDLLFFDFPGVAGQIDAARAQLAAAGCGDKPLELTEIGWPSLLIGDQNQARFLARSFFLAATRGVAGYYWYDFWDGSGGSPPTENYFGLYAYPYNTPPGAPTPKPSFAAYLTAMQHFGAMQFAGDLSAKLQLPQDVYALAFVDHDKLGLALWDGRGKWDTSYPLSLPTPAAAAAVAGYEIDGTQLAVVLAPTMQLTLTPDPIYLIFTMCCVE